MPSPHILLIPGSLRSGSHTTRLLLAAGQLVPSPYTVELADMVRALPHYDADLDGESAIASVVTARARLASASALIISTPEYNGTIPGGLKNWIDWVTRPPGAHVLVGKPIAVVGGSPNSKGAVAAVTWLRNTLGYLGAVVVGDPVAIPDIANTIDDQDSVTDEVANQLRALVGALIATLDPPT
jgi:chromate reductase, NAD(P)H dehydrogenase (quinone)